jgi:hypothetical protein
MHVSLAYFSAYYPPKRFYCGALHQYVISYGEISWWLSRAEDLNTPFLLHALLCVKAP